MPASKRSGDPRSLDEGGPRANFYECTACRFLFSDILDHTPHFYESEFLCSYDKEPGSDIQYMRLLSLAAPLLGKPLDQCRVLDFGSGGGEFVDLARQFADLEVWGFDLALEPRQRRYILNDLSHQRFDIVVAREVVEHFTDPLASFRQMRAALKTSGVIAFQTNLYRPGEHGRDWDYIGAQNGHISLYSEGALAILRRELGVSDLRVWRDFPTIAAWRVDRADREAASVPIDLPLAEFRYPDPAVFADGIVEWTGEAPSKGKTIFYGPYVVRDAGTYTLLVTGDIDGDFELVVATPSREIGAAVVSSWTPPVIFDMPHNTWGWELILRTTPRSRRLRIEHMSLLPEAAGHGGSTVRMRPRRRRWRGIARHLLSPLRRRTP